MKKLFRSKIFWAVVIVIVAIRLITPIVLLPKINAFLADFSPIFKAHIDDLGISVFRGSYQIHGLSVALKKNEKEEFVKAGLIDVSIAWREIFKGQIVADVLVDDTNILLTDAVLGALKEQSEQAKEANKKAVKKVIPLRIERLDVRDSEFEIADLRTVPKEGRWRLTDIDARVSNVTANENTPLSVATVNADLFGKAPVKLVAQMNTLLKPMAWDVDVEMRDFNLPDANPWLKTKIPLSFTSGKFDLYSEVKSEKGTMRGYAKPFFHKADIVATGEKFDGLKNYGIEVGAAAANLLLRTAKDRTMATKVMFTYGKDGLEINSTKAIMEAIKNGFTDKLPEGLDDEISLSASSEKTVEKGEKP